MTGPDGQALLYERLFLSLVSHQNELMIIKKKIINPDVPEEKKKRLKPRLEKMPSILSGIERRMEGCVF